MTHSRPTWPSGLLALTALTCLLALSPAPAQAAVSHTYRPEPSKFATEGVPKGCGVAESEPPCIPGPASSVEQAAGDAGHVWLAEQIEYPPRGTRVDSFDAVTGKYLGPQLDAEGGVSSLTEGLAVGHSTGVEEVYVGAGKSGEYVLAAYGGATGKLQATWSGANTANGSFSQSAGTEVGAIDGVAVDASKEGLTDPNIGDVFVATRDVDPGFPAFNVVDVLKPGVGGTEGEKVGQITGTCKAPGEVCLGAEVVPFSNVDGVAVSAFNGDVLVLDGNQSNCGAGKECVVDVFEPAGLGAYRFLFRITGTLSGGLFTAPDRLAVDASNGNIYVLNRTSAFGCRGRVQPDGRVRWAFDWYPDG